MKKVFDIEIDDLGQNPSPETIQSWDSLKHMNLILSLEEEFKIEFSDDELVELFDYNSMVNILKDKIYKNEKM